MRYLIMVFGLFLSSLSYSYSASVKSVRHPKYGDCRQNEGTINVGDRVAFRNAKDKNAYKWAGYGFVQAIDSAPPSGIVKKLFSAADAEYVITLKIDTLSKPNNMKEKGCWDDDDSMKNRGNCPDVLVWKGTDWESRAEIYVTGKSGGPNCKGWFN